MSLVKAISTQYLVEQKNGETVLPKYLLPIVLAVATLAGAAAPSFVAPKWSAKVLIRIGQTGIGAPLSSPQSVVQRIKFDGFAPQALAAAGLPTDTRNDPTAALVKRSLMGRVSAGGGFVELSVQALTAKDAGLALQGALNVIQQEHAVQLAPTANRLKKSLADVNSSIDILQEKRRDVLPKIQGVNASSDKKFSENVLLSGLIRDSESEIRGLLAQRRALEEQLDPSRTFNTEPATPVYIPQTPSRPSRAICAVAGLVMGLVAYAGLLFLLDKRFRHKFLQSFGFNSSLPESHFGSAPGQSR
ncbi:hypothetical protein [Cupriavidus pauculus]|uniref:hypothetical protein n=1 Tax=Cupriavidus pauculus TaxID=82633 RepID=UPI00078178DA|nr:hypothetical protein [Cupriavidus pauculus]